MNKKLGGLIFSTALSALVLSSTAVQAALITTDGSPFVYDDVLNITWLKNANLAATETFGVAGINSDGGMFWDTANAWIAAMNDANYLGFHRWRLPAITPLNGSSFNYTPSYVGSSDKGVNISAPGTPYAGSTADEIAHLFHNSLGNMGKCDLALSTATHCVNRPEYGLVHVGPFENLTSEGRLNEPRYWMDKDYVDPKGTPRAFDFNFIDGQVGTGARVSTFYVFAVLDGNVSAVPVPAAVWLLGSGLLGLVAAGRKRRAV